MCVNLVCVHSMAGIIWHRLVCSNWLFLSSCCKEIVATSVAALPHNTHTYTHTQTQRQKYCWTRIGTYCNCLVCKTRWAAAQESFVWSLCSLEHALRSYSHQATHTACISNPSELQQEGKASGTHPGIQPSLQTNDSIQLKCGKALSHKSITG